jgi:hypothetical protein
MAMSSYRNRYHRDPSPDLFSAGHPAQANPYRPVQGYDEFGKSCKEVWDTDAAEDAAMFDGPQNSTDVARHSWLDSAARHDKTFVPTKANYAKLPCDQHCDPFAFVSGDDGDDVDSQFENDEVVDHDSMVQIYLQSIQRRACKYQTSEDGSVALQVFQDLTKECW